MERDVVRLRQVLARLGRRLRATDTGSGLTPTQSSLLWTVVRRGPIGLSELARFEGVNATMLSRAVGRLEEMRLARREPDPLDRRAATVSATPAGRRLLARLLDERSDVLRAELTHLDHDELRRLAEALAVLERLAERLKERQAGAVH